MIDLSKHIQEGARLELEAMERLAEECSFCSSMSAQHNAQAMRIDELQADLAALRAQLEAGDRGWHEQEDELQALRVQLAERDAEIKALKGYAEAMAECRVKACGYTTWIESNLDDALDAYRAAYPKED